MKKNIPVMAVFVLLIGCTQNQLPDTPNSAKTSTEPYLTEIISAWSGYDPDPDHPWNRVFRQLYRRTAPNGAEYGADALDPLLWLDTTHLLTGSSHRQAVQVLDEFLSTRAESLIQDSLKRAMFQRDLWAVFDWLASQAEPYPSKREVLKVRLATMIRRVALSKEEILSLPDNYVLAVEARIYPAGVQVDQPEKAFLPSDLLQPGSAWAPIGREGGPAAMTHTESIPFFGRSVFLVFMRSPDGHAATLDFIESLNTDSNPVTAIGTEVALVRRMLLIDDQGELVLSPLVETVQIRHFSPAQMFHEFELDRPRLFEGIAGGLIPQDDLFMLFMGHGDVFENPVPELQASIPEICKACHFEGSSIPDSGNTQSIISYSRQPFSLPGNIRPILFATSLEAEAQTVIEWKRDHETWKSLERLWDQANP
jgi:hypothetical protein